MARYEEITTVNLSKGFQEVPAYVNRVTDNWVSIMILVAIYILVVFGVYHSKGSSEAFGEGIAIAGFFTAIVATLFWIAGFVNIFHLIWVIVIAIISVGIWFLSNRY